MTLTEIGQLQFAEIKDRMLGEREICSPMEIAWFAEHIEFMTWFERQAFMRMLYRHRDQSTFFCLKQALYDLDVANNPETVPNMELDPDQLPDPTKLGPYEVRPGYRMNRVVNSEIVDTPDLPYW
jgi:hypothetical protein